MERDNAQRRFKAKAIADLLFPDEAWKKVEDGIFLSPRRPVGEKSNYKEELRDAQILRSFGHIVYLVPENNRDGQKHYDAIVDGEKWEFKNVRGVESTLKEQFLTSREQAPNVFINLEKSNLTEKEIINALYGARHNERYLKKNKFSGGLIVLKIKEKDSLIFLNVDELA